MVIFCERQTGDPPFSPRMAIKMFASICRERGITRVRMDHYAVSCSGLSGRKKGLAAMWCSSVHTNYTCGWNR